MLPNVNEIRDFPCCVVLYQRVHVTWMAHEKAALFAKRSFAPFGTGPFPSPLVPFERCNWSLLGESCCRRKLVPSSRRLHSMATETKNLQLRVSLPVMLAAILATLIFALLKL
jgi:hypothetical protein